ncbi:SAP domain protein [Talaromyces stipitatus ATCC 10500]|uniref:SAP domain protein n=1 Tax=Talaromyces stipitatus (strain ATCC 10500 / CBS 375.48 / QM 6759 / NRRL 1006) TaxID=441959 RepID=B8MR92_TALSN|nr:SAP domain protein [Talaromyces stipitatus ATCC 10500]EED12987.1 SAP domain protein [Talaromyces stipitatus ATCC 10500]
MSDYSKWKVTELKAELKNRGVPQTGLRLKQDFIDKITELDSQSCEQPPAQDASKLTSAGEEDNQEESKEEEQEELKIAEPVPPQQQLGNGSLSTEGAPKSQKVNAEKDGTIAETPQPTTDESKDTEKETAQDETIQQLTLDQPSEEAKGAEQTETVAEIHKIDTSEPVAPALPEEPPTEENSVTEQSTPAEISTKNEGVDSGIEYLRKRKRRSQSPPPNVEVVKKSKIDNENPRVILKEDVPPQEVAPGGARQDPRFRDLLPITKPSQPVQPEQDLQDDDRQVEPALHPATSTIYIRNLMRPLQPSSLKSHLQLLATPTGKEPDGESLVDFFLDSIKTHCFALFDSVSTASRVRSKLHGAVWPNERDRKPLWVDFVPDEKFDEWIKTEQDASTGRGSQRWEVIYVYTENGVQVSLQEVRNGARPGHTPTAPAHRYSPDAESRRQSQPSGTPLQQQQSGGKGFKALDDRFRSTITKPKLYYLPVSRDIADKRLARFGTLMRKDSGRYGHGDDDMRRITFEDTDLFVDGGPEYRGGRNRGGGRRGGRGPWRGRPLQKFYYPHGKGVCFGYVIRNVLISWTELGFPFDISWRGG